ncbi:MAG: GIY-YIG nuclease family protein [Candidatus Jordarchaeaceae archaeon]
MIDYSYAETGNLSTTFKNTQILTTKLVTKMLTMNNQKGVYSLLIQLEVEMPIQVGKLGRFHFSPGFYVYTGSAMGNGASSLRGRIMRHLSDKKKNFWHIDYFLSCKFSKILSVVFAETVKNREHDVVNIIKKNAEVVCRKFGASDCRRKCVSHLLYLGQNPHKNLELIKGAYRELGLEPVIFVPPENKG